MRARAAALLAVLTAAAAAALAGGCGASDSAPASKPKVALGRGGTLFVERCGRCHTLAAAGTTGSLGPKLDVLRPVAATVLLAIESGPGIMPDHLVRGADARAVAGFVARYAGG